jgi:glyoxylase I family protein
VNGQNDVLGGGGIHHVALKARDFDAAVAFYTDVLGFTPALRWGEGDKRAILLDTGDGSCVEVFAGGADAPEGRLMHLALRCSDVDGVIERVRSAGREVTIEPRRVDIPSDPAHPVYIAFFIGPEGETIELFDDLALRGEA